MDLVRFQNVRKHFGHIRVLSDVTFHIGSGRKLGLIGPNGAGKTSILHLLIGDGEPTGGVIVRTAGIRIGYVPQHIDFDEDDTVLDSVVAEHSRLEGRLREQEHRLAEASSVTLPAALKAHENARQAYEEAGGHEFQQRAIGMLDALGLAGRNTQRISELSGGEKNVLSMTKALLQEPDLLLLDEPANHLDFDGVAWLEGFLRSFKGAVLIVSHNRYLLDRVVDSVLQLDDGSVREYAGNYSTCRATILREKLTQQVDYAANQRRLAHLEDVVHRFQDIARRIGSAKWGKRLRARRSQLERERSTALARPKAEAAELKLRLAAETSHADIALQVRGYRKAFGNLSLFEDAELDIRGGERVALVGANGSGKTTFIRDVVEHGAWDHPTIRIGPSFRIGYCAQEQELLNEHRSVLDELLSTGSVTRSRAYDLLARLLFGRDDFDKLVGVLSGGERNRLQLAKVMAGRPNLLILDEPTNHLDIAACEAVEDMLADFRGTILLVSHDRYLLDKVVDRVIEVRERKLISHVGNFSEFWQARKAEEAKSKARVTTRRRGRDRQQPSAKSQTTTAAAQKTNELDAVIATAEQEKLELERRIAEAFTSGDHREGARIAKQLEQHSARLDELYTRWASRED